MEHQISAAEYRCPGENYPITRAVHLGRLTSFYPACRECPRRGDSAGIASRQVRRLAEIDSRAGQPPLFHAEGAESAAVGDLRPQLARKIAVEFSRRISPGETATVVVASDGRLETAAIFAAIVEGLRWSGFQVVDVGPATAPCTARAIDHLSADAGLFVGNPGGYPQAVGMKFWVHGEPLSQGPVLDDIAAAVQAGPAEAMIGRPSRTFGPLRRFAAADIYLDDFRPAYHALRPLRFLLDCRLQAFTGYLEELLRNVACQAITREREATLGEQVLSRAHFGMQINHDGENASVVDERGQAVSAESLLRLLADNVDGSICPGERLRQATFRQMRASALIAADPAGRLWYATGHAPIPDALQTLTLLLVLLSRDDLPLSEVMRDQG